MLRQAWSVGIATGAYGISFGALGVASGLDVWQTCALSLLMFTGGSQFAFVGVIGAGGTGVAAIATATLLGVRNGLYGLQVSEFLHDRGWQRGVAAHLTIDESTAEPGDRPVDGTVASGGDETVDAPVAGAGDERDEED